MLPMIVGTISSAVKQDMLIQNWEQKKKTNNIFTNQDKKALENMTPEERMFDQFRTQLEQDREQSYNNEIANKIMNGEDLTPEEEQYLARNNPAQLQNYRKVKAERAAYEEKLRKCKTKDEVQRLKTNTMNAYLSELKSASGDAKAAKAMEIMGKLNNVLKAEMHFIKSGGYAQLPTEAEEEIQRSKERSEENEKAFELVKESAESDNEEANYEKVDYEKEFEEEASSDKTTEDKTTADKVKTNLEKSENHKDANAVKADFDSKKKTKKTGKKEKDPVEEIKDICRGYIPNLGGEIKTDKATVSYEKSSVAKGNNINIAM